MYTPPYSKEEIKKNYPKIADKLLKDPAHLWRAETGIELIHKEPGIKEQIRIWENWNKMTKAQKEKSDQKSLELFKMTNIEHHKKILEKHSSKVIFFDLYQTLLDVKLSTSNPGHEIRGWDAFAKELSKYNKKISGLEFQKLYVKRRDGFYSNNSKEIFHHNLFKITSNVLKEDLRLKLSKEEIIELIYVYREASRGHLRLYSGVFNTLSHLSKEYILSTASHTQGSFTQPELYKLDIEKFFSYFIYSSDIGYRKESVKFYEQALEIVGKEATDCMMIGDNYDADVLAPQQLNIRSIWIKNHITSNQHLIKKDPPNTLNLENFEKLPELIKNEFEKPNKSL